MTRPGELELVGALELLVDAFDEVPFDEYAPRTDPRYVAARTILDAWHASRAAPSGAPSGGPEVNYEARGVGWE
jgi:hypothetical protein